MPTPRWKNRPPGSNWGDFGADDELGRLNLLTPAKVREGIAEVVEGKTFCLSLPLDVPGPGVQGPHRHPPRIRPTERNGRALFNYEFHQELPRATDVISDDEVQLTLQYSTQWDALSHVGQMFDADGDGIPEPLYYNGFRAGVDIVGAERADDSGRSAMPAHRGALRLGVEKMAAACLQGRAVMIDLAAHFGRSARAIGYDDLMRAIDQDNVKVSKGDMVCLHTGFSDVLLEMSGHPDLKARLAETPSIEGRDSRLLQWITDSGIVALIADNYAVEVRPPSLAPARGHHANLPLHEHCLFKLGVYLGEMWHFGELAPWLRAHRRSAFLLTAPPLRLPGAVGSPVTPVGTV